MGGDGRGWEGMGGGGRGREGARGGVCANLLVHTNNIKLIACNFA